jgi:tight adherence protein B
MMLIVASLQTGYSLERALQNAENEFIRLYTTEAIILPAIHRMNQKLKMNMQLEKAFMEFAAEIEIEEANSLAEIISFAKRSGGDYGKNIRETALKIEENLAIKEEIETITTEKRLELKVMSGMPLGILAYITITSGSFIAPLYGNPIGVGLMSVCLVAYGLLVMLGRRIIEIRV